MLRRAYIALAVAELGLRIRGCRRLLERVPAARRSSVSDEDRRRAARYAQWLEVAARHHPVRARCLHRWLARHSWLRWEGLPSVLRIGVRKEAGVLRGHAWVELGGQVINDELDQVAGFALLAHLSGPALRPGIDAMARRGHGKPNRESSSAWRPCCDRPRAR